MPEIPQQLVDAVRDPRNRLVPFVGAGLSVSVQRGLFPDWATLIELLETKLAGGGVASKAAAERSQALREAGKLVEAAEEILPVLEPGSFGQFMMRRFGVGSRAAKRIAAPLNLSGPAAVWRLGSELVITTNYDSVLLWPFEEEDAEEDPPRRVLNDHRFNLTAVQRGTFFDGRVVWHLHGMAEEAESLILATSQYQRLYGEGATCQYDMAKRTLQTLMTTRPLLFVGFSLDDPFIVAQLKQVLALTGGHGPRSWLLLKRPRPGEAQLVDPLELLQGKNCELVYFEDFGAPFFAYLHEIGRKALGEPPLPNRLQELIIPPPRDALVRDLRSRTRGLFLNPKIIAEAYNTQVSRATGRKLGLSGDAWRHLREAIYRLGADNPTADGTARLPALVRALKPHCPPDLQTKLDEWLVRAGAAFGSAVAPAVGPAADPGAAPSYLLVALPEAEGRSGWFRARVWLFGDGQPEELLDGERLVDRARVDGLLYDLIDAIEERGLDPGTIDLAFLLPRSLLAEEVDQWRPTSEGLVAEPPIGATFRVTVRPLYARKSRAQRRWERAWGRWKASARKHVALQAAAVVAADTPRALWLDDAAVTDPLVLNQLRTDDLTLGLLPSPPRSRGGGDDGEGTADALDLALQAGLPVLLWARSPLADDPAATVAAIEELLANTQAGELPAELLRRRQAALVAGDGGAAAPASCLALVWDDAERIPPTADPANRLSLTVETV